MVDEAKCTVSHVQFESEEHMVGFKDEEENRDERVVEEVPQVELPKVEVPQVPEHMARGPCRPRRKVARAWPRAASRNIINNNVSAFSCFSDGSFSVGSGVQQVSDIGGFIFSLKDQQ